MLSILIPTHDYTCYQLVADLHQQAQALGISFEIIVAEDGSRSQVDIIANHKITELPCCRHIIQQKNKGRAAIRNQLMNEAKGTLILFIDADGRVVRENFLKQYVAAGQTHDVVCGGVKTLNECHDPSRTLRWKYERAYEQQHGYISEQFRSFCFMISRRVAQRVRFDERYTGYGFEDVQFGKDLQTAGFQVYAIDNPLENADIETNKDFLKKTEEALRTAFQFHHEIGDHITLVRTYERYKTWKWILLLAYRIFGPTMRCNLLSGHPSLSIFSFYKLCYYASL